MSRRKKIPWPPWKSAAKDGFEKQFVQLGRSQLLHESMTDLSGNAFRVYVYMLLESGGKKEFIFPHSKYKAIMSKPTFQKAKAELIEKGFIVEIQNNRNIRKPNQYAFSTLWRGS